MKKKKSSGPDEISQELLGRGQVRLGVINVCPQNDLYHDPHDMIKQSRLALNDLVDLIMSGR